MDDKILDALREEAEAIDAELSKDDFQDNFEPPKGLFEQLVAELKEKGIWEEKENE